jgi:hypothetical protein
MDASDIIRRIQGQAVLKGYNTLLQKNGQSLTTYDASDVCCGFYDASNNTFNTVPNRFPPNYPSYEFRYNVDQGLRANGCVPTNTMVMTTQSEVICPVVQYDVPLGNS